MRTYRRCLGLMALALACGGDDGSTGASAASATASATTDASASSSAGSTDASASAGESTSTTGGEGTSTTGEALACNGHAALCDRRLDEVALPATHNSHASYEDGFPQANGNQEYGVARQLDDGVRGFLMDIYEDGGAVVLCHGPCFLASYPLADVLGDIAAFMAANPNEVIAIIFQDDVDPALVDAEFAAAGLDALMWSWDGGPMPTLRAMIEADARIVVGAEVEGPPPSWYHHAWDVFWDTPYSYMSADEFSCELSRGAADNPLFLVNHWVSDGFGLPTQSGAAEVNAYDVLYARASQCRDEGGQMPTLVAVDFYEQGDLFAVVDALNGL
ncbi:MAG: hypothetical protein R3A79_17485 [Nannocystaceae bacterium]